MVINTFNHTLDITLTDIESQPSLTPPPPPPPNTRTNTNTVIPPPSSYYTGATNQSGLPHDAQTSHGQSPPQLGELRESIFEVLTGGDGGMKEGEKVI